MKAICDQRSAIRVINTRANATCSTVSVFRRLHCDQNGSVMLEHALLLAAFTLPMYLVLGAGIKAIGTYYGMLTFFGSIPFF